MIENVNASKNASLSAIADYRKYIGVASVNIVGINPNNDMLRKFGWTVPDDAEEPEYVFHKDVDGKMVTSARVRFLVQIHDLDDKPVIPLDFWVRQDAMMNRDATKCKIIDAYGRTAWATKAEVSERKIPVYSSGQEANISTPYKPCHRGEEELVNFLMKYLNITPLQIFDRKTNGYVRSANPGRLTIDDWNAICKGDVSELKKYVALQPDNRVKVILGIRTTDENYTYQAFLSSGFIGNGVRPDIQTGEYTRATKLIDKNAEEFPNSNCTYSASVVKEWKESATDVQDNSGTMFDENGNYNLDEDDLPFS